MLLTNSAMMLATNKGLGFNVETVCASAVKQKINPSAYHINRYMLTVEEITYKTTESKQENSILISDSLRDNQVYFF